MIIGIGLDIININRIDTTIKKYGKRFINRCFTKIEIESSNRKNNKSSFFAKRYAAKEACSKALGTGLARGVFWQDIEVTNNEYGKPLISLYNNAYLMVNQLSNNNYRIEVSLSDEKIYAIANVIIYKEI